MIVAKRMNEVLSPSNGIPAMCWLDKEHLQYPGIYPETMGASPSNQPGRLNLDDLRSLVISLRISSIACSGDVCGILASDSRTATRSG